MTREGVLSLIAQHSNELRAMGVGSLELFGSVARGDDGPESDVDLLVEFSRPVGLFQLARIQSYLESLLGRRVDLVPKDGLKPRIRERVLREAIRAA